jgi:methylenetetrahydrofolate--tRNA-(uracil-5-)-methyltransferase
LFAGQISGVEGYVESAASGLIAGAMRHRWRADRSCASRRTTAIGALASMSRTRIRDYQPTNITFGIMEAPPEQIRDKQK